MKRECPNYLRGKGKVLTTTLSDSESSSSDLEDSCDGDGNYFAFIAITSMDSVSTPMLKKMKLSMMRKNSLLKVVRSFKSCMMHYLTIVASKSK